MNRRPRNAHFIGNGVKEIKITKINENTFQLDIGGDYVITTAANDIVHARNIFVTEITAKIDERINMLLIDLALLNTSEKAHKIGEAFKSIGKALNESNA